MDIVQNLISGPKKTIFFDQDGVVAIYERWAYLPDKAGVMPFLKERNHYFRHCGIDDYACALVRACIAAGHDVYILTKIPPETPFLAVDKVDWLRDNLPEINEDHIIIATSDKAELIKVITEVSCLNENMILIDDYNPNLEDWIAAGGKAIKYINGLNNPDTFDGDKIYRQIKK